MQPRERKQLQKKTFGAQLVEQMATTKKNRKTINKELQQVPYVIPYMAEANVTRKYLLSTQLTQILTSRSRLLFWVGSFCQERLLTWRCTWQGDMSLLDAKMTTATTKWTCSQCSDDEIASRNGMWKRSCYKTEYCSTVFPYVVQKSWGILRGTVSKATYAANSRWWLHTSSGWPQWKNNKRSKENNTCMWLLVCKENTVKHGNHNITMQIRIIRECVHMYSTFLPRM